MGITAAAPAATQPATAPAAAAKAPVKPEAIAGTGDYVYTPEGADVHTVCTTGTASDMAAAKIKSAATVNDGAQLGKALALPTDGTAPAGCEIYKGTARLKASTAVTVLDFSPDGKYAQVSVAGATYWIEGGKITYGKAKLQPPYEPAGMRTIGSGKNQIAIFKIASGDVFVPTAGNFKTFDLKYASALPGQADAKGQMALGRDSKSAAQQFNAASNAGSFQGKEAKAAASVLSWASGIGYGDDGKPAGGKVDSACVVLATKPVDKKTTLSQVRLFSGQTTWVAQSNVHAWGSAFRWSIEQRPTGTTFVKARDANVVKDEKNEFPIDPAVAALIKDKQTASTDALLAKQSYTPKQSELIAKATAFSKDPKLGNGLRTFAIPGSFLAQDGETLNMDLVGRLQTFYQFLQYSKIITDAKPEISSGIRGRPTAHKMSVNWMLNPGSGKLATAPARQQFAQNIVAIQGKDKGCGETWADAGQIARYTAALPKLADEATKAEAEAEILAVTKEIQNAKGGVPKTDGSIKWNQGAQAIEGYPTSDKENRMPNISDCSVSNHCGGEAMDITFPFVMNYFDPIIDAVALKFGLYRPVKDSSGSPEHWHYERVGG